MADAHGALSDLTLDIERLPNVACVRIVEHSEHSLTLLVELSDYNPDVWDRIVRLVDDLAREQVYSASIDLDLRVLSSTR